MLYLKADNGKLSGRADGNVYMRNGRVRAFFVPRLVQNAYTTLQRSLFAQYSQAWASLTQSEQDSWNNVDNQFRSNRFGVPQLVRGKQLFIERNVNLTMVGSSPVTAYPLPADVPGITSLTVTGTTAAGAIITLSSAYLPTPTDATVDHLVFATSQQNGGINRPKKSSFRLIGVVPGATASPFNTLGLYSAKYGTVGFPGQKIFVSFKPINNSTGQSGVQIQTECILT